MTTVTRLLEALVENCSGFDEMPHSVDDSLMDKIVERLEFDESSVTCIRNLAVNCDFERRTIPIQMVIRLIDAALDKDAFRDEEFLLDFVVRSEGLLNQKRPLKLLDALFKFYCNPRVWNCRRPDAWINVIHWSLNQIDDGTSSVFLRRLFQEFLCQLSAPDARRLRIISGFMGIFTKRAAASFHCNLIIDAVTRFLEHFAVDLEAEECISYMESSRNAERLGENSLKLLVTLRAIHGSQFRIPLTPGSWKSEANRCDVITMLLESQRDPCEGIEANSDNDTKVENVEQLIDLLLYSPSVRLHHKTKILHRMTQPQLGMFLEQLKIEVKVENKISIRDLTKLLPRLVPLVETAQIASLFEALDTRVLESVSLVQELSNIYGLDVFQKDEFAAFRNRLRHHLTDMIRLSQHETNWEMTDTALEIANIFPCFLPDLADLETLIRNHRNKPYVMVQALKLLRDHYNGIPANLCDYFLLCCADAAPKLICIEYLSRPDVCNIFETEQICQYIEAALVDSTMEVKEAALKLAERAKEKPSSRAQVIDVLTAYRNDRWVGRLVRRMLAEEHQAQVVQQNESVVLLEEMLSALQVRPPDDDVLDCY